MKKPAGPGHALLSFTLLSLFYVLSPQLIELISHEFKDSVKRGEIWVPCLETTDGQSPSIWLIGRVISFFASSARILFYSKTSRFHDQI